MAAKLKPAAPLLYLYGITESKPRHIPELIGVSRFSKVESIVCDGVVSWVSRVSALDFGKNLERNMENLDWLAEASVAHQRVIAAIGAEVEILPARLGTIFRTEASLCKHVLRRLGNLKSDFKRIRGADEWGIKVFQIPSLVSAIPSQKIRTGRDYLKAKAATLPVRRKRPSEAGAISELELALERVAKETAPVGKVSHGQRGLTYQTTLLVERSKRKLLEALLKKFARNWVSERRIECTGPWPPYSFVSRPDEGAALR